MHKRYPLVIKGLSAGTDNVSSGLWTELLNLVLEIDIEESNSANATRFSSADKLLLGAYNCEIVLEMRVDSGDSNSSLRGYHLA